MKSTPTKAFEAKSAVLLGIGSMLGAGMLIVIGQAGSITGNIVWLAFILGGIIAIAGLLISGCVRNNIVYFHTLKNLFLSINKIIKATHES